MQIPGSVQAKLLEQVTAEFSAAHKYLAMACALDAMGLKFLCRRFLKQHEEEREHAMKFVNYLREVGATVTLESIPKPKGDYKSAEDIVSGSVESERHVTRLIHELVALAEKERDFATRSFLNWFVDEQVEEVATMTDLLRVVQLAGANLLQVEAFIRHTMVEDKD